MLFCMIKHVHYLILLQLFVTRGPCCYSVHAWGDLCFKTWDRSRPSISVHLVSSTESLGCEFAVLCIEPVMLNFPLSIKTLLARPNAPRLFQTLVIGNRTPQDAYEMKHLNSRAHASLLL